MFAQTKQDKPAAANRPASTAIATFAGGCFWCTEADFDKVDGVISTTSGYIGGRTANPTYDSVSAGNSGHAEAVQVVFDPSKVTYSKLLEYYWRTIDPTTKDRQFCDSGNPYRTAIFTHDEQQRALAEASKKALSATSRFANRSSPRSSMQRSFIPPRIITRTITPKSGEVQVLPRQLRPRRATEAALGIPGAAVALHRD